jgi:hypothetical protein
MNSLTIRATQCHKHTHLCILPSIQILSNIFNYTPHPSMPFNYTMAVPSHFQGEGPG